MQPSSWLANCKLAASSNIIIQPASYVFKHLIVMQFTLSFHHYTAGFLWWLNNCSLKGQLFRTSFTFKLWQEQNQAITLERIRAAILFCQNIYPARTRHWGGNVTSTSSYPLTAAAALPMSMVIMNKFRTHGTLNNLGEIKKYKGYIATCQISLDSILDTVNLHKRHSENYVLLQVTLDINLP